MNRDEIGEAIAEGYRRIPQSGADESGDLSKLTDATTAQTSTASMPRSAPPDSISG